MRLHYLLPLFILAAPLQAKNPVQVSLPTPPENGEIDNLIAATEQKLRDFQELKQHLQKYQLLEQAYMNDPDNKELLMKLIREASRTMRLIQEYQLTDTFPPKFMKELALFANVGNKRGVPRP